MLRMAMNLMAFLSTLEGVSLPASSMPDLFKRLDTHIKTGNPQFKHQRIGKAYLSQLKDPLQQTADLFGKGGVTIVGTAPKSPAEIIRNIREELLHRWQRERSADGLTGKHLSPEAFARLHKMVPEPIAEYLSKNGYTDDPENFVVEATAKIMAGQLTAMKVSDRAKDFLSSYYQEVVNRHGSEAVKEIEHTRGVARKLQVGFQGEETSGSEGP